MGYLKEVKHHLIDATLNTFVSHPRLVDAAFNAIGFRQEFAELDRASAVLLYLGSRIHTLMHGSVIEGSLPVKGPAIITSNHHRNADSYKGALAGAMVGRVIRTVIKLELVDPNYQESAEYLASIQAHEDDGSADYNPRNAAVLKGIGAIAIPRSNPGFDFVKTSDQILRSNQLYGIFIQPTRHEDGLLGNLAEGAASFAIDHKDVPVVPMACSGPPDGPDKLVILPSFTYAQKKKELGRRIPAGELTIMIVDMIARGSPARVQEDWFEKTRAVEMAKLMHARVTR